MKAVPAFARALLITVVSAVPASAADPALTTTKAFTVTSDLLGLTRPRMLPGTGIDYTVTVTNPYVEVTAVVLGVTVTTSPVFGPPTIIEQIPVTMALRVSDLAASGSGPVEFLDGTAIPSLGLLTSGLAYTYAGLSSQSDSVSFYSATDGWSYVPRPDASGYDSNVRQIRIILAGTTFRNLGSIRIRYRSKVQ